MEWSPRQYLIGFNMVPGIGGRRLLALEEHFGCLAAAWHASRRALAEVRGIGPKIAEQFCAVRSKLSPIGEEEWAAKLGAKVITLYDADYPRFFCGDWPFHRPSCMCRACSRGNRGSQWWVPAGPRA